MKQHERPTTLMQQVVPLVPSSALSVTLLGARWLHTGSTGYAFLLWNLFLAWLPLGLAWAATRTQRGSWQAPLLVLWLLFFPNAPYLVSDLMHLRVRVAPLWYDTGLLASFALAGMLLAIASLRLVKQLVANRWGSVAGWTTVALVCGLSGFGVYLGRFMRLNSWDALVNPFGLFHATVERVAAPHAYPQTWGVSLVFAALLLAAYVAFDLRAPQVPPVPEPAE